MLATTKLTKLENELNDLQKATRTRMLTMAQIVEAITAAEAVVKNVRRELRAGVRFEYHPHQVAKSYRDVGYGTSLAVEFNAAGKAVNERVDRTVTQHYPKSRLVLTYDALVTFVENELGIKKPEYGTVEFEQWQKLLTIVLRESGFNHQHTQPV